MDTIIQTLIDNPEKTNAIAAVASVVIATIALVVGALSIFLGWRTLKIQKTHNQLSVKPLPFIAVADYEDRLWVKMVNNGSGPLIVKSTHVYGSNRETAGIIERMPKLPQGVFWKSFTSGMIDRSILPGHELFFVDLEGQPNNLAFSGFRDQCRLALSNLTVKIEYTDVYGDEFEPVERTLEWFGRNMVQKKVTS